MKNFLKSLKKSNVFIILVSVIAAFITSTVILLIGADILVKNDINLELLKYFWFVVSGISSLIAGLISGRMVRSKGIIWGSVSSFLYIITLMLIIASVNKFNISILLFILLPLSVFFGALGGVISSNLK